MLLVAILTIDAAKLDHYRAYERRAAQIMARYGGRIERVLVMTGPEGAVARAIPPPSPPPKRGGILGAIEEVAHEIDREVENVLHPNDPPAGGLRELHVVSFPDDAAYEAYRFDSELAQLATERERYVRKTEIWRADEGPTY